MMRKRAVAIVIIGMLILSACSENEQLLLPDNELSGELIIALDAANHFSILPNSMPIQVDQNVNYPKRPINEKIQGFMKLYPEVTVKVVYTHWLVTRFSGLEHSNGNPGYAFPEINRFDHAPDLTIMPDIIELTPHQVRFAALDLVQDLSFYIENIPSRQSWEAEYKNLINLANIDGKTYLLPVRSDPMIMYFSAPIFQSLNIEIPNGQWTWQDFFAVVQQLQQEGYVVGDLMRLPSIEHIIYGLGGEFISEDKRVFTGYIDSIATQEALNSYFQAINPVPNPFTLSWWGSGTRLTSTWPAMGMARSSRLYHLFDSLDGVDRGYDIVSMPQNEHGEHMNTTLLTGLAMTNGSKNKELAWEFMKYVISGDEQAMQFVAKNTLLTHEERYIDRPPIQYDKLLSLIQSETAKARVSALSMVPTFESGIAEGLRDVPWEINDDEYIDSYLPRLAESLESIRDTMIERGLGAP